MKKYKKNIVSILSLALILGLLPISVNKVSKASESEYGVSNPRISNEGVVTWDCIYFGSYWQNDTNGDGTADQNDEKEPIKWRVLSVDDNDAFLLADQNLDCQPYNEEDTDGTWETCTLRSWLNSIFYQNAFSVTEQNAITETTTVNAESGNDTNDKVYLLSNDEVMNPSYGFTSSFYYAETRKSKNTAYATECANMDGSSGPDSWWLLSPFFNSSTPPVEGKRSPFGVTNNNGYLVGVRRSDYNLAVRPVLHLNLSSSEWSKADTVSAEGGTLPTPTPTTDNTTRPTITTPPTRTPPTSQGVVRPTPTISPLSVSTATPTPEPNTVTAPGKVQKLTAKNSKKKTVTVTWKKVSDATGYQIQYAVNAGFAKKRTKNTQKTKIVVKKLKKKKTYSFRVRAYKVSSSVKVYGNWCKAKKVKVKK